MSIDQRNRERKFQLSGWILFIVCAGFFIASAIKADDILVLAGSIIFLGGCVVFIIPMVIKGKQDKDSQD
ncbi:hypothetical protein ACFLUX_02300 [Chloroflexota bacterium]